MIEPAADLSCLTERLSQQTRPVSMDDWANSRIVLLLSQRTHPGSLDDWSSGLILSGWLIQLPDPVSVNHICKVWMNQYRSCYCFCKIYHKQGIPKNGNHSIISNYLNSSSLHKYNIFRRQASSVNYFACPFVRPSDLAVSVLRAYGSSEHFAGV